MNHFILRLLVLICLVCVPSRGKLNKIRVREVSGRGDLAQNLPVPVESVVFGGDAHATMTTQPTEFLSTFDNKRVSVPTMNDVDNYLILTANGLMHVLDKSLNHLSSHDTGGLLLNSWQQENDPNLSILPAADGTVIVQENEGMRKTSVLTRLKDLATHASGEENQQGVHVTGKMSQTLVGIPLHDDMRGRLEREPHRTGISTVTGSGVGVGQSIPIITEPKKMLYFSRRDWTVSGSMKTDTGHFAEKFNLTYGELNAINVKDFPVNNAASLSRVGTLQPVPTSRLASSASVTRQLPLVATPEGDLFFTDESGTGYRVIRFGSTIMQVMVVSSQAGMGENDDDDNDAIYLKPLDLQCLASSPTDMNLGTINSKSKEGKTVAVLRHLKGGGMYAVELSGIFGSRSEALVRPKHDRLDPFICEPLDDSGDAVCPGSGLVHWTHMSVEVVGTSKVSNSYETDLFSIHKDQSENLKDHPVVKFDEKLTVFKHLGKIILRVVVFFILLMCFVAFSSFPIIRDRYPRLVQVILDHALSLISFLRQHDKSPVSENSVREMYGSDATENVISNSISSPNSSKALQIDDVEGPVNIAIDGVMMTAVGSLLISDTVLGYGSHGTVVLLGNLDGRQVAVKRMLTQFIGSADREISLLIRSDGHPNVVRYFLREQKSDFLYLALQLCHMSLRDFVSQLIKAQEVHRLRSLASGSKGQLYTDALNVSRARHDKKSLPVIEYGHPSLSDGTRAALRQLSDGLMHLHSKKIVHRDIKPHNILLAFAGDAVSLDRSVLLQSVASIEDLNNFIPKISDMGLSKHLESKDGFSYSSMNFAQSTGAKGSQSSTIDSAVNPVGTIGWQAPEILHLQRKLMSDADLSSCISTSTNHADCSIPKGNDVSVSSSTSRLQTVDIFSLGCVYHYVLFPGEHPFGEWFEREANIMNGHLDLQHLKQVPDLLDLLSRMLANDPMHRPSAAQVSAHPFFWSSAKRLDFLVLLSDRLEREPSNSPIMITLESNAATIVGRHWDRKLHSSFLEDLGKYRKYDTSSVRDCLRVIRNKKHHFLELSEELKLMMSPVPNGFLMYFEQRFPRLLLHVASTAAMHLASEKEFQDLLGSAIHLFVRQNTNESTIFREALEEAQLAISSSSFNEGISLESINRSDRVNESSTEITIWSGSRLCEAHGVRGWWESGSSWDTSFSSMHYKARARPGHLVKSITDWKYRSRLCTHWELTAATACPMRRKGKCDFAHGPIELRIKESRRDKWGARLHLSVLQGNAVDLRASGGEDVLGAARSVEKIRMTEGSVSEFERTSGSKVAREKAVRDRSSLS